MEQGYKFSFLGYLKYLKRYKFLIEQLVARDFKAKYKRSVLGVFWSFLNPLLMMAVQYFVFTELIGRGGGIPYYAMYLLIGIVVFNGVNDCCNQAMRSIVGNAGLITKVYVPKFIYPVTKSFSALVNTMLAMIPLLMVALINQLWPHWSWFFIPLGLLMILLFATGMGLLLSALMVFFRDMEFLWGVFATVWMYGTPIIYDIGMLKPWMMQVEQFNPLYHYISFMRTIIISRAFPSATQTLICLGMGVLFLGLGAFVFKKTQDKFVFYI